MAVLVTGASGYIGKTLVDKLLSQGHTVYGLSRHPPAARPGLIPLEGDITLPNLGLAETGDLKDITIVYHLAGVHTLRLEDKDGEIYKANVLGTRHVLDFCLAHDVPRLAYTSTAYAWPVNPYGRSKDQTERDIAWFQSRHKLRVIIFKPSIVLGTRENPYPGHFTRFVSALIQIHHRAELIRRKIEGTMRLPVLEPLFRIKGNPEGKLNLVPISAVTEALAAEPGSSSQKEGIVWLTNPSPPTLGELAEWVSEFILVNVKFVPEFKATPLEATFAKLLAAFEPYLTAGDNFPSDLKECPPITKELIFDNIRTVL